MLFYIAIALIVAVFIYFGFVKPRADIEEGFIAAFIAFVVMVVALGITAAAVPKETKVVNTWTQPLSKLTEYTAHGNIFIENDPHEVEYIFKDARGALVQGEVAGGNSTIREGAKTATVKTTQTDHYNYTVVPWVMGTSYHYEFNVPKGSVFQEVEAYYESEDD